MNKKIYPALQLKRGFRLYGGILLITLVLIIGMILTAFALMNLSKGEEKKQIINVGVVGNVDDSYLGIGVYAIKNMDSSRFYVELIEMSEKEADKSLRERKIAGYVFIPEGFVKSITRGTNKSLTYVTNDDPAGFGKIIEEEIVMTVSDLVTESQKSIYAAIELARDLGADKGLGRKIDKLNLSYINYALNRTKTHELVITGISDDLGYGGYYICAAITFLFMIWGISSGSLLSEKNYEFSRLAALRGIGAYYQIFSKLISFFIITLITGFIFAVIFGIGVSCFDFGIDEIDGTNVFSAIVFLFKIIPVILMFSAMHIMLYEIFSGSVGGILIQFILAIGLGYVSGIFYPNTFFPETLQSLASVLPTGAGFSYIRKTMSGMSLFNDLTVLTVYTFSFYLISVFVRSCKIKGESKI